MFMPATDIQFVGIKLLRVPEERRAWSYAVDVQGLVQLPRSYFIQNLLRSVRRMELS